ncbi:Uncharacterized conserved protein YjiS, DUF1127 family [Rhizobium sp. 9140]|nr:DUF1127 domain-containing protein [Rhizobium sp. 9140]CZT35295.1 Uncharacterized conserved protein YjiS, DUF1127 family [Rhizobium sp. 9140]
MSISQYNDTIGTIYPDGFERERLFRSSGDMVSPPSPIRCGFFGRMTERFAEWRMKRAGRLVLRDLTDDQLNDIGLTRWEVREELGKSYFIE